MATYAELRQQILITLDKSTATPATDDIYMLVDACMKTVLDELVVIVRPVEMIGVSAAYTVTSSHTVITTTGNFAISDMAEPIFITVDENPAAARRDIAWEPMSYIEWLQVRYDGDTTRSRWILDPDSNFILSRWPSTGTTWEAYLYYFKKAVTISDLLEPPIPVEHHRTTFVSGVCQQLPHLFKGEKVPQIAFHTAQYREGKDRLLRKRKPIEHILQMKGLNRASSRNDMLWPGYQSS